MLSICRAAQNFHRHVSYLYSTPEQFFDLHRSFAGDGRHIIISPGSQFPLNSAPCLCPQFLPPVSPCRPAFSADMMACLLFLVSIFIWTSSLESVCIWFDLIAILEACYEKMLALTRRSRKATKKVSSCLICKSGGSTPREIPYQHIMARQGLLE
jgi:hypothetical protein